MRRALWIGLLAVGGLTGAWASEAPAADPWVGKNLTDVQAMLGEPNKTKSSGDGATLTYKLVRLEEGALPPAGIRVLNVPGIGVVGQVLQPLAMPDGEVAMGPTEMDEEGRRTGGGVSTEQSLNVSYDFDGKKGKKVEKSWEERPTVRGKITLKFEVDAEGGIVSWSVSPKKAASGR